LRLPNAGILAADYRRGKKAEGFARLSHLPGGRKVDRGDDGIDDPQDEDQRAADVLKDEGYKMSGNAPIYAILREARDRAVQAGAKNVEEKAVVGAPVDALVDLADEVKADLLVVGNVGLSTIAGRLLGSVPANVARRSKTDVLIVHTTP